MTGTVELPVWVLVVVGLLATLSLLERLLFPSVRWFFRKRMERVVARLNTRLSRPIEPFKLARRHDMIQRLIYDPDVALAISEHAQEEGIPEAVAFEQAEGYAREIVPSFSATAYFGIGTRGAKWLSRALYRVRLGAFDEALSDVPADATVIFVMNHRSNMDYVLVTYLVSQNSALSYAVGEWARVWPLSRLIKSMGAYFIRRKSRNQLYRRVLARYVQLATAGGVTQAVFPEGGLSLDGKTAPPKLGLLNYIVNGFDPDKRDVVFVPVALNYDRILEDRILMAAGEAGERRFRAKMSVVTGFVLKQIWLRITGRFYRFGYASVSFGTPLSLSEFVQTVDRDATEEVGIELMKRIEDVVPVLPVPLLASVLLAAQDPLTKDQVLGQVKSKLARMNSAHIHMPRDDVDYAVDVGLRALKSRRMIEITDDIVHIRDAERASLRFYANSIAHLDDADAA